MSTQHEKNVEIARAIWEACRAYIFDAPDDLPPAEQRLIEAMGYMMQPVPWEELHPEAQEHLIKELTGELGDALHGITGAVAGIHARITGESMAVRLEKPRYSETERYR
jgi:hypothetical protein